MQHGVNARVVGLAIRTTTRSSVSNRATAREAIRLGEGKHTSLQSEHRGNGETAEVMRHSVCTLPYLSFVSGVW